MLAALVRFLAIAAILCAAQDNQQTTFQANFTIPAGWTVTASGEVKVLSPPEGDSHVALVEVTASDPQAAAAAAWAKYKPEMKRPVRLTSSPPPREGWQSAQVITYETSPNEKLVVVAAALQLKGSWTVVLLHGTEATVEKRGAQFNELVSSLRPRTYQRESFAGRKALPLTAERIGQLKAFVESSMMTLQVPGTSMALIDGGEIVFQGGFGIKETGKPTPVDENTLFMAASNTKGMATLLLSTLADEKKLRWDQPAVEVYPKFKLGDANVTSQVLMKHLVCACTGMPRQDLDWIFEYRKSTPASSLSLLGTMKPTSRFGEVFQYSNLMASAAGYIGAALYAPNKELGAAFDLAMDNKIFTPLGMTSTTFSMAKAQKGNYARPHAEDIDGKITGLKMDLNYSVVPHRPAGGVWTSAHDLIRYVQLELNKGKLPNGKQLVSEENILARRSPQIATGEDRSYGMGLSIDRSTGVPVVHHGGSLFGYKSDLMLLPDHGVGAVLLTNADNGGAMLGPFQRRLLEVLFEGKPEAVANIEHSALRIREQRSKERIRLSVPADSASAAELAKKYRNRDLGALTVRRQGPRTIFDLGEWQSEMATRTNDDGTVSFLTIDPGLIGLEFVVTRQEGNRGLIVRDAQHEYLFSEHR